MTTVSSLDHDVRKLRMSRYTPDTERETRGWIERTLGEKLPPGDLMTVLKDGTVLCRLINHTCITTLKFKKSALPFVQMENISHFLQACEDPPFNLPGHDRFLTVDLYESKDPAQVLQCLGAFSRVANALVPEKVPTTIGPQSELIRTSTLSAADSKGSVGTGRTSRAGILGRHGLTGGSGGTLSPSITGGSASSRGPDPVRPTSSLGIWNSRATGSDIPAWNYIQYGSMHGANQGNQGVVFGARRQIVPPSLANAPSKRVSRTTEESEDERRRARMDQLEEEERRAQEEIDRRRAELEKLRQEEFDKLERQKREWERQEQEWNAREQARLREDQEAEKKHEQERERRRKELTSPSLNGQFPLDYQTSVRRLTSPVREDQTKNADPDRVVELERQLQEAKERERQYLLEREQRHRRLGSTTSSLRSRSSSRAEWHHERDPSPKASEVSWAAGEERLCTRTGPLPIPERDEELKRFETVLSINPPQKQPQTALSSRPLPDPAKMASPPPNSRPLPDPLSSPTTPRPHPNGARPARSASSTPVAQPPAAALSSRPLPKPGFSPSPRVPVSPPRSDSPPPLTAQNAAPPKPVSFRPLPKPAIRKSSQTVKTDLLSQAPRLAPPSDDQAIFGAPGDERVAERGPERGHGSAAVPALAPPSQTPTQPSPRHNHNQALPPRPTSSLLGSRPLPRPAFGSVRRSPFGRMSPERVHSPAPDSAPGQNTAPVPTPTLGSTPNRGTTSLGGGTRVPSVHLSREMQLSSTAEQDHENDRRRAAQQKAHAASMASKSLLEREMERERQRVSEWEEEQQRKAQSGGGVGGRGGVRDEGAASAARTFGRVGGVAASPTRSPSRLSSLRSPPSRMGDRGPSPFARTLVGPRPGP